MFPFLTTLATLLAGWSDPPALFLLASSLQSAPNSILHEESGGFSYMPPPGWTIAEFPGLKYRIAHGPAHAGFSPNIVVVDEHFSGTLEEYVDANLVNMRQLLQKLKVLQRQNFSTKSGEPATRVLTENVQTDRLLRQTFFFLGSADRKYVLTCTALADGGEIHDLEFSASAETFRVH
jgi:hypothetical protein